MATAPVLGPLPAGQAARLLQAALLEPSGTAARARILQARTGGQFIVNGAMRGQEFEERLADEGVWSSPDCHRILMVVVRA
ncbi:MAG: hypothetical protein H0V74_03925 [Chloroflexi bacterium]|nr:hypothetical protein [Chloroflexota bacterium]